MFTYFLALFLAASPVLAGRVADPQGKPIPSAIIRVETDDGRSSYSLTDSRGEFRAEVSGRFLVEIRHSGFRTLRSASASLLGASADDVYQAAFSLLPGDVNDIETVEHRWYDPNAEYFRVRTPEGKRYVLRYDQHENQCTLQGGFDGTDLLARPGIQVVTVGAPLIESAPIDADPTHVSHQQVFP